MALNGTTGSGPVPDTHLSEWGGGDGFIEGAQRGRSGSPFFFAFSEGGIANPSRSRVHFTVVCLRRPSAAAVALSSFPSGLPREAKGKKGPCCYTWLTRERLQSKTLAGRGDASEIAPQSPGMLSGTEAPRPSDIPKDMQ